MISILMATYNGGKYLAAQIDSLLKQTFEDFTLYIQDDCSSDDTMEIAQAYARKYPGKIHAVQNAVNSGGAKYNFLRMMAKHRDDYLMLCDQDDIWLPDKIGRTLGKMKELEKKYGKDTPLLVHSDLRVVDGQLNPTFPSFKKTMNANYNRTRLRDQVIQNTLTGCTAMYNRAASEMITVIPAFTVMHDWWLMLLISAFGHIDHLEEQLILYRQHGNNEIGAKNFRSLRYKLDRLFHGKEIKKSILDTYLQAREFLNCYKTKLSQDQIDFLEEYCAIPSLPKLRRVGAVFRLHTFKNGLSRNIAYLLFL